MVGHQKITKEYLGEISLFDAFAKSINTVAVKLSESIGRENVINMARSMGITSPILNSPSLALGTSEVNLLELTAAYDVLANSEMVFWFMEFDQLKTLLEKHYSLGKVKGQAKF